MNKYMQIAYNEALKGMKKNHGGPFGCVIIKDNKIIAKEHNKVIKTNDPTSHGEINAIRKASKKLKTFNLEGCKLYTTGEPCPMCLSAIMWANIKEVYYGCSKEDTNNIGFIDNNIYKAIKENAFENMLISSIDKKECLKLYKIWKNNKNKIQY